MTEVPRATVGVPGGELVADLPASAAELSTIVRDAGAVREGLRLAGAGTWLDAGHPVRATRVVSLRALAGITSYNPADLTLTCGAGTTLEELDHATRRHGQWCPLAVGPAAGAWTVGATVSTAFEGPFAATLGRPRSLVLGLECVDGTGRIIAAGGRVVKNVAGFDLTRAMVGAWGTLGAITQVHLRLRARPAVEEWWAVRVPHAARARFEAHLRGPLAPLACVPARAAGPQGLTPPSGDPGDLHRLEALERDGPGEWFLLMLGGNRAFVTAAREAVGAVGLAERMDSLQAARILDAHRAPPRALHWRWDPISLRLRDRFDPHRIMNPGLLGEPA